MNLQEKLLEDMKKAMKSKEKERLSVIRMARAAIKDVEIDQRKDLGEDEIIEVLASIVKKNKESLAEYKKAANEEKVAKLEREIEIIQEYLPEQLTEEELNEIVDETIAEVGAEDMSDMGQVMGKIMPKIKGRADGSKVNQLVRERLGS